MGIEPYFERPEYYEFRVGDYQHELGLMDARNPEVPGRETAHAMVPPSRCMLRNSGLLIVHEFLLDVLPDLVPHPPEDREPLLL